MSSSYSRSVSPQTHPDPILQQLTGSSPTSTQRKMPTAEITHFIPLSRNIPINSRTQIFSEHQSEGMSPSSDDRFSIYDAQNRSHSSSSPVSAFPTINQNVDDHRQVATDLSEKQHDSGFSHGATAKKEHDLDFSYRATAKKKHDLDFSYRATAKKERGLDFSYRATAKKERDLDFSYEAIAKEEHDLNFSQWLNSAQIYSKHQSEGMSPSFDDQFSIYDAQTRSHSPSSPVSALPTINQNVDDHRQVSTDLLEEPHDSDFSHGATAEDSDYLSQKSGRMQRSTSHQSLNSHTSAKSVKSVLSILSRSSHASSSSGLSLSLKNRDISEDRPLNPYDTTNNLTQKLQEQHKEKRRKYNKAPVHNPVGFFQKNIVHFVNDFAYVRSIPLKTTLRSLKDNVIVRVPASDIQLKNRPMCQRQIASSVSLDHFLAATLKTKLDSTESIKDQSTIILQLTENMQRPHHYFLPQSWITAPLKTQTGKKVVGMPLGNRTIFTLQSKQDILDIFAVVSNGLILALADDPARTTSLSHEARESIDATFCDFLSAENRKDQAPVTTYVPQSCWDLSYGSIYRSSLFVSPIVVGSNVLSRIMLSPSGLFYTMSASYRSHSMLDLSAPILLLMQRNQIFSEKKQEKITKFLTTFDDKIGHAGFVYNTEMAIASVHEALEYATDYVLKIAAPCEEDQPLSKARHIEALSHEATLHKPVLSNTGELTYKLKLCILDSVHLSSVGALLLSQVNHQAEKALFNNTLSKSLEGAMTRANITLAEYMYLETEDRIRTMLYAAENDLYLRYDQAFLKQIEGQIEQKSTVTACGVGLSEFADLYFPGFHGQNYVEEHRSALEMHPVSVFFVFHIRYTLKGRSVPHALMMHSKNRTDLEYEFSPEYQDPTSAESVEIQKLDIHNRLALFWGSLASIHQLPSEESAKDNPRLMHDRSYWASWDNPPSYSPYSDDQLQNHCNKHALRTLKTALSQGLDYILVHSGSYTNCVTLSPVAETLRILNALANKPKIIRSDEVTTHLNASFNSVLTGMQLSHTIPTMALSIFPEQRKFLSHITLQTLYEGYSYLGFMENPYMGHFLADELLENPFETTYEDSQEALENLRLKGLETAFPDSQLRTQVEQQLDLWCTGDPSELENVETLSSIQAFTQQESQSLLNTIRSQDIEWETAYDEISETHASLNNTKVTENALQTEMYTDETQHLGLCGFTNFFQITETSFDVLNLSEIKKHTDYYRRFHNLDSEAHALTFSSLMFVHLAAWESSSSEDLKDKLKCLSTTIGTVEIPHGVQFHHEALCLCLNRHHRQAKIMLRQTLNEILELPQSEEEEESTDTCVYVVEPYYLQRHTAPILYSAKVSQEQYATRVSQSASAQEKVQKMRELFNLSQHNTTKELFKRKKYIRNHNSYTANTLAMSITEKKSGAFLWLSDEQMLDIADPDDNTSQNLSENENVDEFDKDEFDGEFDDDILDEDGKVVMQWIPQSPKQDSESSPTLLMKKAEDDEQSIKLQEAMKLAKEQKKTLNQLIKDTYSTRYLLADMKIDQINPILNNMERDFTSVQSLIEETHEIVEQLLKETTHPYRQRAIFTLSSLAFHIASDYLVFNDYAHGILECLDFQQDSIDKFQFWMKATFGKIQKNLLSLITIMEQDGGIGVMTDSMLATHDATKLLYDHLRVALLALI